MFEDYLSVIAQGIPTSLLLTFASWRYSSRLSLPWGIVG